MSVTPQCSFPELSHKEVGGEITYNDYTRIADVLVAQVVQQMSVDTPPTTPVHGQVWIIGDTAAWPDSVRDGAPTTNYFAQWYNGAWYYIPPVEGYKVYSIVDGSDYRYLGGSWQIEVMSLGRSGGLYLSAPTVTTASITPTPTKITGFDSAVAGESGVITSIPNSTLTFTVKGIWMVNCLMSFIVVEDSSNTTREVGIEIYNASDALVVDVFAGAVIPRYGAIAPIMASFMVEVTDTHLNDEFEIRILSTSGHTITVSNTTVLEFSAYRVNHQGFGP